MTDITVTLRLSVREYSYLREGLDALIREKKNFLLDPANKDKPAPKHMARVAIDEIGTLIGRMDA